MESKGGYILVVLFYALQIGENYGPIIMCAMSTHGRKSLDLVSCFISRETRKEMSGGSEAMFADLGHFNRSSIRIAFFCTIYPSLVLTYAGQTAYLIRNPDDHFDGFFKFIPSAVYWPIFVIATLAAIVASQSLISATFSVIKQSVVLDYFPRVKVVHTSSSKEGEVYSPEVNYILMILCVAVILVFGDGQDIGNAFEIVFSCLALSNQKFHE
ncbi:hypothetical protein H5410_019827 [Solanum commersonii]|uniref:K+ potassium transporter integral membrane domain-containing protein n=1 Tax=Solanum commersonii TaxID=4109 RepID=A0A9J5Z7F3_SOLCO|nr:hypothetical protein H5410_019827 [Solanum commersonii]